MVSLNSRVLRSLQVSILCLFLYSCISGQGICDLKNDPNEVATSKVVSPGLISSSDMQSVEAIVGLDGQVSTLEIEPYGLSGEIRFSDFQAQLPVGSVLQGMEIMVTAVASNENLTDVAVRLIDGSGNYTGEDKANKSLNGQPWSIPRWTYGGEFDMWQATLEDTDINSAAFGVGINLYNASSDTVEISIDQVAIRLHYYMPLLICGHPCVSILSEEDPEVISYRWTASPELVTEVAFEQPHIFNIFANQSPFGEYEICVTKIYNSGEVSTCCRALSYRDCSMGSIGDQIWADSNGNGIFDNGEEPADGVSVELYGSDESLLESFRTTASGTYRFDNILLGEYFLRVSAQDAALSAATQSDAIITNLHGLGTTSLFRVQPGENREDLDFGIVKMAQVCGNTFLDTNVNGAIDQNEAPLADVTIEIFNSNGLLVANENTALDGTYCIEGLWPGTYNLVFVTPDGYQVSGSTSSLQIELESGESREDINQGYYKAADISGSVWMDANRNEQRESNENGIPSIEIVLSDCSGVVIASAITDAEGAYVFAEMPYGDYVLCSSAPGAGLTYNSALLSNNGCTQCVSVNDQSSQDSYDFAVGIDVANVDFVSWIDENNNGQFDQSETAVPMLPVHIVSCLSGETVENISGTQGAAHFDGVVSGTYYIHVDLPDTYIIGNGNIDFTNVNGPFTTSCFDVMGISKEIQLPLQLAPVEEYVFCADVYEDINGNNRRDANEEEVTSTIFVYECTGGFSGELAQTSSGFCSEELIVGEYELRIELPTDYYLLPGADFNTNQITACLALNDAISLNVPVQKEKEEVIEEGSIIVKTFLDDNENGVKETGEAYFPSVNVTLFNCSGLFVAETTTDLNGEAIFSNLPKGDYYLQYAEILGYTFSDDVLLSGTFGVGTTACISIDGNDLILEEGYHLVSDALLTSNIRGLVWLDSNENGLYEVAEQILPGIEVILLDLSFNMMTSTMSSTAGYVFEDLTSGQYIVQVVIGDEYTFTEFRAGGVSALDSEILESADGMTQVILLDGQDDITAINAGLIEVEQVRSRISGRLWVDSDADGIESSTEEGLVGTVALIDQNNNIVSIIDSDPDGRYAFDDVVEGDYFVQFEVVAGYSFVTAFAGGANSLVDSDVVTSFGRTELISVVSGDQIEGINAGYTQEVIVLPEEGSISGTAWLDADRDGLYELATEVGMEDIAVDLLDTSGNILRQATTDNTGTYVFAGLSAGIYVVRFEAVDEFIFTQADADLGSDFDSDVNQQTGITRGITLGQDENKIGINAGYEFDTPAQLEDASISGIAWLDLDGDGILGNSETGFTGVRVDLLETGGTAIAQVFTNQDGRYSFIDLASGSYSIRFSTVPDYDFVDAFVTGGDNDSEANPLTGVTRRFDLSESEQLAGVNAGYKPQAIIVGESAITGLAWFDKNGNGLIGIDEIGIPDVTVELLDASNNNVASVMTDKDGRYVFTDLVAGDYIVRFEQLADYKFAEANVAPGTKWDSDVDESTGYSQEFSIVDSETIEGINAGYRLLTDNMSSISGLVWFDGNKDGLVNGDESGIDKVRVFLRDRDSFLITEAITDIDGFYEFSGLSSGAYILSFDNIDGHIFTTAKVSPGTDLDSDVRESDGYTRLYALNVSEDLSGINAGYKLVEEEEQHSGTISGLAWFDEDADGIVGASESGLEGVRVFLRDRDSLLLADAVTNLDGRYRFSDLEAGIYILNFEGVPDLIYTVAKAAVGTGTDSDVRESDGYTRFYLLEEGQQLADINSGYKTDVPVVGQAVISGQAWFDEDQNGLIGATETGIDGVDVFLYDEMAILISQTTTDIDGSYQFEDLESGKYSLKFGQSLDFIYTEANVAAGTIWDSEVNADGNTPLYNISYDSVLTGINAGYRSKDPVTVEPSSISGLAWLDIDEDGIIDSSEPGIQDVIVFLRDQDSLLIQQTLTDVDGLYEFNDLQAGQYLLSFGEVGDLIFTTAKAAVGTTIDSDVRESDGYTRLYSLVAGQELVGINSGYKEDDDTPTPTDNTVAGVVWEDLNGDGLLNDSETGTPNLRVRLLSENDEVLGSMFTDEDGRYEFANLSAGNYKVDFFLPLDTETTIADVGNNASVNSNLISGLITELITLPVLDSEHINAGYYYPVSISGWTWLDVNSDGIQDDDESGTNNYIINLYDSSNAFISRVFTNFNSEGEQGHYFFAGLAPGDYYIQVFTQQGVTYSPTAQTDATRDSDISGDNGFGTSSILSLLSGESMEDVDIGLILEPSTIGDYLWIDANGNGVQDDDEQGLNGVVVELYNNEGKKVNETITGNIDGEDGRYLFEDMYPTEYYVQFIVGEEYAFTESDLGGVDSKDSDVNNSNGYGTTSIFLLSPGEADLDIDGGVFLKSSIGNLVWHDRNLDGDKDSNEPGVADVEVILYKIDDLNGATVVETTTTNALGNYRFEGLANGDYYLTFIPDETWEFTSMGSGSDTDDDSNTDVTGVTSIITISNNQSREDIDAGLVRPSNQIGGQVWNDENTDGLFSTDEELIEGIVVWLMTEDGMLLTETQTDIAGRYVFGDLDDGEYFIKVASTTDYVFTEKDFGNDDRSDSDFDASGDSELITLGSGNTVERHIDAGLIKVGKISPSTLYPNPVVGKEVNLSSYKYAKESEAKLLVFDEQGALRQTIIIKLDEREGNYEQAIDISVLPTGFYYLKLNYQRRSEFLKLIKIE